MIQDKNVLHMASMYGHVDIARYLVEENQCDPMSKSTSGHTSLSLACKYGHIDFVRYLVDEQLVDPTYAISETLTPLLLACSEGHLDVVKYLIEKGCDHTQTFQVKDGYVANLLHLTAMGGHVDTARYLIEEKECDPTSKTIIDHTPLSLAGGTATWRWSSIW